MNDSDLTHDDYWDRYWSRISIPAVVADNSGNALLQDQLDTINAFISPIVGGTALEIGGAPGQYLAYFAKKFGYRVAALDYSAIGCDVTRRNFAHLGIDVTIYHQDLFALDGRLPQFDLVYSLGVVEHFSDLDRVIEKHLELLKPGGVMVIGVPHFVKVFAPLLAQVAPKTMAGHNLAAIDLRNWACFEEKHRLQVRFKGYLGGFEPMLIKAIVNEEIELHGKRPGKVDSSIIWALDNFARVRRRLYRHAPWLEKLSSRNSARWSAYAMAIYTKPNNGQVA